MKIHTIALVLASLAAAPALAQGGPHHGHRMGPAAQAPSSQDARGATTGMPGMPGMAGMMNCPMMQGRMAGMAGHQDQPQGDQSAASLALDAVNRKMHRDMAITFTGNADADFARSMIAHHQGAIDMAKVVLAFGKDPQIRKLAEEVIRAQEGEITMMQGWLKENVKP